MSRRRRAGPSTIRDFDKAFESIGTSHALSGILLKRDSKAVARPNPIDGPGGTLSGFLSISVAATITISKTHQTTIA